MTDYKKLLQKAINGETSALIAYAEIKEAVQKLSSYMKEIEDYAREEASTYEDKNFQLKDFNFELRSGATRYSFKKIKEWVDKSTEIKEIELKYKQAYKASQNGLNLLSKDAEIISLPEVTHSKDSVIVKRIKQV